MTILFFRTIVLYLVIIIALRVMGKRQIGELSSSEFVITILVSQLATVPMGSVSTPLVYGVIPILTLLSLEIIISSLFVKNRWIRKIVVGHTSILIENGKINQSEMKRLRLTLDELLEELRLKSFMDISTVKYAILEANGELSVFPFSKDESVTKSDINITEDTSFLPFTIISDGILIKSEAMRLGKNEAWIKKQLTKKKIKTIKDVFLMQADETGNILIIPKEKKQ